MYFTYTYAVLMAVTSLELYRITMLAFSDWAVVKISMNLKLPLLLRILPDWCIKKKRWSRSMGQLNLLNHCLLYKEWPKPVGLVLDWFGKREFFSCHWLHSRQPMPLYLRALVLQKMAELEDKRKFGQFSERGKWTLEIHGIQEKQGLSGSLTRTFAKSIIVWHIATETLHSLEVEKPCAGGGSKFLSEYMTYLLALHPYMLSLTTADITLEHACRTLRLFLRYREYREAISTLSSPDGDVPHPMSYDEATIITRDWDVLLEVQKLVADLRTMDNKWEIISSIWVEMLCYAAHKSQVYHHCKLLKRGGELITHVWLLLAHKTDKDFRKRVFLVASKGFSGRGLTQPCMLKLYTTAKTLCHSWQCIRVKSLELTWYPSKRS